MSYRRSWILILLSLFLIDFIPIANCQESNVVHIQAFVRIYDVNFNEGKMTLTGFHLSMDANKSFGVYLFSPSKDSPNYWDSSSSTGGGWYWIVRDYFQNGIELKFDFKEWIFYNDALEVNMLFGLNVTTAKYTQNVNVFLNLPLEDKWNVNGTITKVSKETASRYALYGMQSINSSITQEGIKEFYVFKIEANRKSNLEDSLNWFPPLAMFFLLVVSLLIIWKGTLANCLMIYLTVAFPAITYFSFLKGVTPPIVTSIEWLTLIDIGFSFIFAIIAVIVFFTRKSIMQKKSNGMNTRKKNDDENMKSDVAAERRPYSDYFEHNRVIVQLLSLFGGFLFTSITLLLTLLQNKESVFAQATLLFLTTIFYITLYTLLDNLEMAFHYIEEIPPMTLKIRPFFNLLVIFYLFGTATIMLFILFDLVPLALAAGIIWAITMILSIKNTAKRFYDQSIKRVWKTEK